MKTNELTGAALDWAVAKCEGRDIVLLDGEIVWRDEMRYSTDWAQGGPIIEREKIGVWFSDSVIDAETDEVVRGETWYAEGGDGDHVRTGKTPLIAAMRCYVASKLGDEVELPEGVK
jgi:hypothetical protein